MSSDQETRGFLPPTNTGFTFTDEHHRQPPPSTTTLTGNSPHHLPRFTELYISPSDTTTQDSHLPAAHGRAIFTIPSTVSAVDVTTSSDQEHTTTTSTPPKTGEPPRKNPLRRTLSDITSSVRKTTPSPNSNEKESPQSKRLRKTKELVTEIQQKCWELRAESRVDNPSQAIVKQDEVRGEFVKFKRLDDGGLNIKLSCSCGKCFEFLHNRRKCYYKIDIAAAHLWISS